MAVAFVVGLATTVWGYYMDGDWNALPLLVKIGRINGFVISLAIVLYMAALMGRGALTRRQKNLIQRSA